MCSLYSCSRWECPARSASSLILYLIYSTFISPVDWSREIFSIKDFDVLSFFLSWLFSKNSLEFSFSKCRELVVRCLECQLWVRVNFINFFISNFEHFKSKFIFWIGSIIQTKFCYMFEESLFNDSKFFIFLRAW